MWGTQEPASWKFLLVYQSVLQYNVYLPLYTVFVLGWDEGYMVKYNPLPQGTPEGKGLYLPVYPESSPNTDIV